MEIHFPVSESLGHYFKEITDVKSTQLKYCNGGLTSSGELHYWATFCLWTIVCCSCISNEYLLIYFVT